MKLTIRLDDITPGMDWEKFARMKKLLDAAGVKPVIGVVPRCEDPKLKIMPDRADFWEYVRALQDAGWVVALHGWKHVYTTKEGGLFPLNHQSEFAGLPLHQQKTMLQDGKAVLNMHGIETDLFMAPSHTYDANTLRAMKDCGLTRMTDGFGRYPYEYEGIVFYPISFDRKKSLKDTKDGVTTLVYHCNTMKDADFNAAAGLLQEQGKAGRLLSYEEFLQLPAKTRTQAGQKKEYLMATAKRLVVQAASHL